MSSYSYSSFHGDGSGDFGGARGDRGGRGRRRRKRFEFEDQSHHGQGFGGDPSPSAEDFDRDYEENFASASSCSRGDERNRRGRRCSVYVGRLPDDVLQDDVRKHFRIFGKIVDVRVLRRVQLPTVAFVDFEDERDAQDAIKSSNSFKFEGRILRVEMAVRRKKLWQWKPPKHRDEKSWCSVNIFGLPKSASWQDIKDHARKLGFHARRADVYKDSWDYDDCDSGCNNFRKRGQARDRHRCHRICGVLRFSSRSETLRAARRLNGTVFTSHESETATIRAKLDLDVGSRSRSRSGSLCPSRRRNRCQTRSRSRSRSRSYSKKFRMGLKKRKYRHHRRRSPSPSSSSYRSRCFSSSSSRCFCARLKSRSRSSRTRSRSPLESNSMSRRSRSRSGTPLGSNSGSRWSRSRSSSGTQNSFMPVSSLSSKSRSTSLSLISSDVASSSFKSRSRSNRRYWLASASSGGGRVGGYDDFHQNRSRQTQSKMRPHQAIDIKLEPLTPSPPPRTPRQIESFGGLRTSKSQQFLDDVSPATSQPQSPALQSISSEELEEGEID